MGQDTQRCALCNELCGYDDEKALWSEGVICSKCKRQLWQRFMAHFGASFSAAFDGLTIDWEDVKRILDSFSYDAARRIYQYTVTYKEMYERRKK